MRQSRIIYLILFLSVAPLCVGAQQRLPQRIISVSPNVTEMLYGVGAFDRVVAVSDYCTYPPAVKSLPRVGGWQTSNLERIVALHPDLVILTDAQAPFLEAQLRQLGFRSLVIPSHSLNDVFVAIEKIGSATGRVQQAAALAQQTRASLDAVRNKTKNAPPRSVLFVVDRTPGALRDLYVATQGSYLDELIEIAGGKSIAALAKSGYAKISKEAVLALNPEIIIDMVHVPKGRLRENLMIVWNDLPELRAVREKHIYPVSEEFIPHASQFVADAAKLLAGLIHSDLYRGGKQ
jgi:iron complex transport system substrate-binding protein